MPLNDITTTNTITTSSSTWARSAAPRVGSGPQVCSAPESSTIKGRSPAWRIRLPWIRTVSGHKTAMPPTHCSGGTIPDPNSMFGYGYQSRAFYWQNGVMQDLGTLGTGTDAMAGLINERGQVLGQSYVDSNPSAFCSNFTTYIFTTGSFVWDKKNGMQDIGTLGGTCTLAYDLNNEGQVVGESSQVGDPTNLAFVWDRGEGIKALPTGANLYGAALAINNAGAIAGYGDAPDGQTNAIFWRKTGGKWRATYLGNLHSGDCALGQSINASGQVVGISGPNGCTTTLAFLWEDGGPMADLNTLVPPNSGLQLVEGHQINDRGEIAVGALDANGNNHSVLLIPCDENHPGVEGCDYSMVDAAVVTRGQAPQAARTLHGAMRNGTTIALPGRLHSSMARR